jgi:hypothetical protein
LRGYGSIAFGSQFFDGSAVFGRQFDYGSVAFGYGNVAFGFGVVVGTSLVVHYSEVVVGGHLQTDVRDKLRLWMINARRRHQYKKAGEEGREVP